MALQLAYAFINDNTLVRWTMKEYIKYILYKDKSVFIDLSTRIIDHYQKPGLSKKERILMDFVVSLITQSAILDINKCITNLFDGLICTKNEYTLSKIIFTLREERFLTNPNYNKKIIKYFCAILEKASPEIIAEVDFALFYNLVNINKSLYPHILPVIETVVNTEFPKTTTYNNDFHFTILDYLDKFHSEIVPKSEVFLISLIAKNVFLLRSVWSCKIVDTLDKIMESQKIRNKSQVEYILKEIKCFRKKDKVERLRIRLNNP